MSIFEYDEEKEMGRIRKTERAEGEEVGQARGERIGLERGAVNMIITLKKLGISKQDTLSNIIESFGFAQAEAEELVDKNWN